MSVSDITIKQVSVGPMENYTYVIADNATGDCAVVDPCWDADQILKTITDNHWQLKKILLTHMHYDHINALENVVAQTQIAVYVHEAEFAHVQGDNASADPTISPPIPDSVQIHLSTDGECIAIGNSNCQCLHTPGHTPGSQCFLIDKNIITGDTVFIDACGRTDLPGGSPDQMNTSLHRITQLNPDTIIYPGHAYGRFNTSTIAEQCENNPYLAQNR